jgi:hypothetical protein
MYTPLESYIVYSAAKVLNQLVGSDSCLNAVLDLVSMADQLKCTTCRSVNRVYTFEYDILYVFFMS